MGHALPATSLAWPRRRRRGTNTGCPPNHVYVSENDDGALTPGKQHLNFGRRFFAGLEGNPGAAEGGGLEFSKNVRGSEIAAVARELVMLSNRWSGGI